MFFKGKREKSRRKKKKKREEGGELRFLFDQGAAGEKKGRGTP